MAKLLDLGRSLGNIDKITLRNKNANERYNTAEIYIDEEGNLIINPGLPNYEYYKLIVDIAGNLRNAYGKFPIVQEYVGAGWIGIAAIPSNIGAHIQGWVRVTSTNNSGKESFNLASQKLPYPIYPVYVGGLPSNANVKVYFEKNSDGYDLLSIERDDDDGDLEVIVLFRST